MDNYNTCSFVIIHSITNTVIPRTPFYGTEPGTLPLLPQGAFIWNEGFHLNMLFVKKESFVTHTFLNVTSNHSVWLNASHGPHFWLLCWSWLQAARVKLHLWVSQPHSVYFCIWRKGDGVERGSFGAKQTARVSTLKVNITLCLNYTPSALQFSHTLALSPLSLIPANTPSSWAQLNTPLIPAPSHKSGRKSTSDKVSPPRPAALSQQLWLYI